MREDGAVVGAHRGRVAHSRSFDILAALRDPGLVVRVRAEGREPYEWPVPRDLLPPAYGDVTLLLRAAE